MSMTKKHFTALARAIASEMSAARNSTALDTCERTLIVVALKNLAEQIGRVCEDANPNFNWSRWYAACGVE